MRIFIPLYINIETVAHEFHIKPPLAATTAPPVVVK